jgi:hypothetical protein
MGLAVPLTIQDAIGHLYRVAVTQGAATSPPRLDTLARLCIQELESRGLSRAQVNREIGGCGRPKNWDVVWEYEGKCRLAISLKSLLKNLPGTVPNRIDDLMGEVANAQLHSPEIVLGYVMIIDVGFDEFSSKHGCTWSELLRRRLAALSGRRPPAWTIGTIEGLALIEVDFRQAARLVSGADEVSRLLDCLVEQVTLRNARAVRRSATEHPSRTMEADSVPPSPGAPPSSRTADRIRRRSRRGRPGSQQ